MRTILLTAMLILCATFAHADGGYKCKVLTAVSLNDKGSLSDKGYTDYYLKSEFTVDKGTV